MSDKIDRTKIVEFMQTFLDDDREIDEKELESYEQALTHSSNGNYLFNNQRFAFLGDAILKYIIREHFYRENPRWEKGSLTQKCADIESDFNYASIAISFDIFNHMIIKNPAVESNETVNGEVFEALFGAIYLCKGIECAAELAYKYIIKIHEIEHRITELAVNNLGIKYSTPRYRNEAYLDDEPVIIKSAHKHHLGIVIDSYLLTKANIIIAVLENKESSKDEQSKYTVYKVNSDWYKSNSTSLEKKKKSWEIVEIVKCEDIRENCEKISELTCDF